MLLFKCHLIQFGRIDRQSPRPRRPVPPLPTSQNDSRVGPLQFGPPQKQFISSPTTPQQEKHSSQKTIFLQPVPATPERIPHNSGEYGVHPSTSDPNLPPTYPPLTQGLPGNPNQPNATFTLRSIWYIIIYHTALLTHLNIILASLNCIAEPCFFQSFKICISINVIQHCKFYIANTVFCICIMNIIHKKNPWNKFIK